MKKLAIAILPFAFMAMSAAQANSDIFYTVPFHNVEIKPASKIYVNFPHSLSHREK